MAKVHILNFDPDRHGGGWTAARYLHSGLDCVEYDQADTVLITGPTMAEHDQVDQAKRDGKKVVLRVDNAVRDSRNRGTGMSRMQHFAQVADLVIYQSNWARNFLKSFLNIDGAVILNGVDTKRFSPPDTPPSDTSFLYVRSSRDEGKQWIAAWYYFVNSKDTHLNIVGKFSAENIEYNFDFYNNEHFTFWGEQRDMAPIYKANSNFLYSYLNDACSNTLLEAKASGCKIVDVYGMLKTGGAPEIMACEDISLERMIRQYREAIESL